MATEGFVAEAEEDHATRLMQKKKPWRMLVPGVVSLVSTINQTHLPKHLWQT
jgi:hypothetical protein